MSAQTKREKSTPSRVAYNANRMTPLVAIARRVQGHPAAAAIALCAPRSPRRAKPRTAAITLIVLRRLHINSLLE